MSDDILEAKRRLPLPQLMERFGFGEHAKGSARCPWHEDGSNSFSVWEGDKGWRFKCHAGCGSGDEITCVQIVEKLSNAEATKRFLAMAGGTDLRRDGAASKTKHAPTRPAPPFDWQQCAAAFSDADEERLCEWRGLSAMFCAWLREHCLVGLHEGCIAFPVHDAGGVVVAAHYRLKDGSWRFAPKGTRVRSLVIGDLSTADQVHVFESQWDALTVRDVFHEWELDDVAFVITRGAANGALVAGLARPDATVFAWPQNDPEDKRDPKTGRTPAEKWLDSICQHAGTKVQAVLTPAMHKDPNDWRKAGGTADDFLSAIQAAKTVPDRMLPRTDSGNGTTAPNGSAPSEAHALPFEAFYDAARKEYLVCNAGGRWLSHTVATFKLLLRKHGIPTKIAEGARLSPAETIMLRIQDTRDVRYAGPLAGRETGFYDECGVRFLVTDSPRIIVPVPSEWPTLRAFLTSLVGSDPAYGVRQLDVIYGWLKVAHAALTARKRQPGQALALAGPVQCGKSLLQDLITFILGGRTAKPWRYMAGRTDFNSELFAAEHLAIEDEQSTTDIRSRLQFGANLKAFTVNEGHSCHGKNREAVSLRPFWRVSLSLNDKEESLLVLPPFTDDIADKIILLKCAPPAGGFPTGNHEKRAAYWQTLTAEIPAFLYYLTRWEIPSDLQSERFGVAHFHHPDLLETLESLSPETRLLELIDRELWQDAGRDCWQGTASELESLLRRDASSVRFEAQRLFTWAHACGAYLARIAEKHPARVSPHRSAITRAWIIRRQQQNSDEVEN